VDILKDHGRDRPAQGDRAAGKQYPLVGDIKVTGLFAPRQNAKGTTTVPVRCQVEVDGEPVSFIATLYDAGRGSRFAEVVRELGDALKADPSGVTCSIPTSLNPITGMTQYAGSALVTRSTEDATRDITLFSFNDLRVGVTSHS
jgi:hypothetical protein